MITMRLELKVPWDSLVQIYQIWYYLQCVESKEVDSTKRCRREFVEYLRTQIVNFGIEPKSESLMEHTTDWGVLKQWYPDFEVEIEHAVDELGG